MLAIAGGEVAAAEAGSAAMDWAARGGLPAGRPDGATGLAIGCAGASAGGRAGNADTATCAPGSIATCDGLSAMGAAGALAGAGAIPTEALGGSATIAV